MLIRRRTVANADREHQEGAEASRRLSYRKPRDLRRNGDAHLKNAASASRGGKSGHVMLQLGTEDRVEEIDKS